MAQQTGNQCPKCGRSFGSFHELQEHEKKCKQMAKTEKQVEGDAMIEDRFEATDN